MLSKFSKDFKSANYVSSVTELQTFFLNSHKNPTEATKRPTNPKRKAPWIFFHEIFTAPGWIPASCSSLNIRGGFFPSFFNAASQTCRPFRIIEVNMSKNLMVKPCDTSWPITSLNKGSSGESFVSHKLMAAVYIENEDSFKMAFATLEKFLAEIKSTNVVYVMQA